MIRIRRIITDKIRVNPPNPIHPWSIPPLFALRIEEIKSHHACNHESILAADLCSLYFLNLDRRVEVGNSALGI